MIISRTNLIYTVSFLALQRNAGKFDFKSREILRNSDKVELVHEKFIFPLTWSTGKRHEFPHHRYLHSKLSTRIATSVQEESTDAGPKEKTRWYMHITFIPAINALTYTIGNELDAE